MWGWNTNGELGLTKQESKVVATPTLIDFTNDQDENIEVSVKKVQCGNTFTICMTGIFKEKKKKKRKRSLFKKKMYCRNLLSQQMMERFGDVDATNTDN